MNHAAKIAREDALTDALRAADEAISQEEPTDQAFRIIAAIKRLREGEPARVPGSSRVDYMARVQGEARAAWAGKYGVEDRTLTGPEYDAVAGIDTPIGRLKAIAWRTSWSGGRGFRTAWAGEYYLDDEPITVAEIKAAGLAQRPTTRNRQRKEGAK